MLLVLTDDTDIKSHLCSDRIEYNDINIISVKQFFEENPQSNSFSSSKSNFKRKTSSEQMKE